MLRTKLVLPDGTELFSGVTGPNAIQAISITESVNGAQELTLGSTCANMVDAKIIAPEGGLTINAGDDITVYRVDETGEEHLVGIFTTEKPTRPSANSMSITAYDRVSWLDKDLTLWLEGLDQWPYPLIAFAREVCKACGVQLVEREEDELPNSTYLVQRFSADGITGRKLMQWAGEIFGRFCRATPEGKIEFAWYSPAPVDIGTSQVDSIEVTFRNGDLSIRDVGAEVTEEAGNLGIASPYMELIDDGEGNVTIQLMPELLQQYFFQNGLSFEEYETAPIEKVQLRQNEDDVGTVYPDTAEEMNTYAITGNYLLTASKGEDLVPVAKALHDHLSTIQTYTPCKVSIPSNLQIRAGHIVRITDRNGKQITAYVMTRTQNGQRDTLECTGSPRLDSSSAVNNQSFKAYVGKLLNLRTDVEGIRAENADTTGKVAQLQLDVDGISTMVKNQSEDLSGVKTTMTQITQQAGEIQAMVTSIRENGAEKVTNRFGLTIDESYVRIQRDGADMRNEMNERGMQIIRGESGLDIVLQADADGVKAADVTVRNYLIVGENARFEDFGTGRTACYWLGGSDDGS